MFTTRIRRNIRLAEAPSFGQSIFQYAPDSHGAEDYKKLAEEVIRGEGRENRGQGPAARDQGTKNEDGRTQPLPRPLTPGPLDRL